MLAALLAGVAAASAQDEDVRRLQDELSGIVARAGCARNTELWGVSLGQGHGTPEQARLLRSFLDARDGDVAAAQQMLEDTLRWRRENGMHQPRQHESTFPTRLLAAPECGQPRIVLSADSIGPAVFDDSERLVLWWVAMQEAVLSHVFASPAGRYTLVVDCRGLRKHHVSGPARACATELAAVMARYYPDMIDHTDVVNAPPWFACCWAMLRPFLPRDFVAAVRLSREPELGELQELAPLGAGARVPSASRRSWRHMALPWAAVAAVPPLRSLRLRERCAALRAEAEGLPERAAAEQRRLQRFAIGEHEKLRSSLASGHEKLRPHWAPPAAIRAAAAGPMARVRGLRASLAAPVVRRKGA